MQHKKVSLLIFSLLLASYQISPAATMSDSSKLKVAAGTIASGAIGGGLAVLLTRLVRVGLDCTIYDNGWIGIRGEWDLSRTVICSLATAASALLGGSISYYCFTPEGKLSRAAKKVKSVDQSLLHSIDTSQTIEEFAKKIQFHYKNSSFPTIAAFEHLQLKRPELISAKEALENLLKNSVDYPQLEAEINELLSSIDTMLLLIEQGVDLIRSDAAFETKWQAYMLEKRLREIQSELASIKMQNALRR